MAIARATGNTGLSNFASSATSVSKAFTNNVAAGSLLVAFGAANNANETMTFSDNNGNTWTSGVITYYHSNLATYISFGYAPNANAGATTVQQAGASAVNRGIIICEYTGVATASPVDGTPVTNFADGSTSNPDPGAITSTGEAVFIGAGVVYPTDAPTVGTGYTSQYSAGAGTLNYAIVMEDQIFGTAQTNNPKYNSDEDYWAMLGIAFKVAAGGGGGGLRRKGSLGLTGVGR